MGVWNEIPPERLEAGLAGWDRGRPLAVEPTPHGIENSNFFVTLQSEKGSRSEWVLTVMTDAPPPTGLEVLRRLDRAGLPVAAPVPDREGRVVSRVDGHPALLAPRRPGEHPDRTTAVQCREIGTFLARMHRRTRLVEGPPHPRDLAWLQRGEREHRRHLAPSDRRLLERALTALNAVQARRDWQWLPHGVVHGDLFRDNVLFEGDRLTAVIDFHHAARGPLLFDLAVTVNDWCVAPDGSPDPVAMYAMLRAYARERALAPNELLHFPTALVLAATRFWVARLDSPRRPPAEMRDHLALWLGTPPFLHPDLLV